ncbi:MAG TPA: DUF177 domain-containing protein [Usitatibacter sp.]|nr:DUF177 domain-containing protein [Usitatibacter sp.]
MSTDEAFLIHPDRLSDKPHLFEGIFRPGDLERLEDSLANGEGELRYRIAASLDRQRRRVVSCIIEGFVFLTCQASLEPFRHDVSVQDRLVLVERESELPGIEEESDDEDYLVAAEPLDIRDLVEDAVLLALPMVPRKPGLEEAPVAGAGGEGPQSPFAALAGLKGGGGSSKT